MNYKNTKLLLADKKEVLFVIISTLVGLYLRIQTLKWHRIFAYDPYFYYRQAVYFANGGHIHDIDPMIATTIRRFSDNEYFLPLLWAYLGKIFRFDLWTVGIYLPLAIFIGQIIIIYKIGKEAFNQKTGYLAALFLSIMGAHIYRTHAGGIWKDTLGSLFMLMFLHATILILKKRKLDLRNIIIYGIYLGLSLYLSMITFDGFGEFSLVVSLYLILMPVVTKPLKNEFLISILMVPVLVLGGLSVGTYWPWSEYPLKEIYLFVPFVIIAGIAVVTLTIGSILWRYTNNKKWIYGSLLSAGFLISAVVVFWSSRNIDKTSFWYPIYRFIHYLINPQKAMLSAQSMFVSPKVLTMFFSTLFFTSVIGGMVLGYSIMKSQNESQRKINLLFLVLFIVGVFLGIATIRLTYLMSFSIAFTSAIFFDKLHTMLQSKLKDKNKVMTFLLISLLITTIPPSIESKHYVAMTPLPNDYWLNAMTWMENNIPNKTIFNWWDWGHWIQAADVKTTSDNIYQRGNEYAWFLRVNENLSINFIRKTQSLTKKNTGRNITIEYVIISQDLLLKINTINLYYPQDKKFIVYPFTVESIIGNTRIYSLADTKIVVTFNENETHAIIVHGNTKRSLNKIIVDMPSEQNRIYEYGQDTYIAYITPTRCFLIPSHFENSMLVKLLVFERSKKYHLVYDNGYVKIYKVGVT